MESESAAPFLARHEFLVRRLHSLSGLLPVGAYMVVHLLTNASVLGGAAAFQDNVDKIHSLGPALPFVEWTFIFIPLIFHALVGVWIIQTGLPNTSTYNYVSNFRYLAQRVTAWIALLFIGYHVFQMHGWIHADWATKTIKEWGGHQFDPHHATSSAAIALSPLWVRIVYAIGILSTVFHLANGLWTMGITWGVWTTPAAQRRANYFCAAFGIFVAIVGLSALGGMSDVDVVQAQAVETARIEQKEQLATETERIEKELRADAARKEAGADESTEPRTAQSGN